MESKKGGREWCVQGGRQLERETALERSVKQSEKKVNNTRKFDYY